MGTFHRRIHDAYASDDAWVAYSAHRFGAYAESVATGLRRRGVKAVVTHKSDGKHVVWVPATRETKGVQ